jgi:NAD(P)H dehydrogenase (quinone)
MNIAISLGNSTLGRHTIDFLLERGVAPSSIKAVTRNREKAQDLAHRGIDVRQGDYGHEHSFRQALEGVDRLFMISGMAPPEERIHQHRGIIDAAKHVGVSQIAYTSFIDTADDSPLFAWTINKDTEAYLKRSGLGFTILRNGMYSEADLGYIGEYLKAGKVANNIGDGRISYISRRDLALAAVLCLLEDEHKEQTYTLTGPKAVTQAELAQNISEWTGNDIPYVKLSDEEYQASFSDPMWGKVIVALYQSVRLGNTELVTSDFENIVGRQAFTLDETYERFYRSTTD